MNTLSPSPPTKTVVNVANQMAIFVSGYSDRGVEVVVSDVFSVDVS